MRLPEIGIDHTQMAAGRLFYVRNQKWTNVFIAPFGGASRAPAQRLRAHANAKLAPAALIQAMNDRGPVFPTVQLRSPGFEQHGW